MRGNTSPFVDHVAVWEYVSINGAVLFDLLRRTTINLLGVELITDGVRVVNAGGTWTKLANIDLLRLRRGEGVDPSRYRAADFGESTWTTCIAKSTPTESRRVFRKVSEALSNN